MPWSADSFGQGNWRCQLVETDPLLAYQFQVEEGRAQALCGGPGLRPTDDEVLRVCLSPQLETIPFEAHPQPHALLIKAHSLNLEQLQAGMLAQDPGQGMYQAGNDGSEISGPGSGPCPTAEGAAKFIRRNCELTVGPQPVRGRKRGRDSGLFPGRL
jgi:hypothetical protein